MTWSYSGNPADSTRDAVRFLIGDTLETDKQFQNEELDYLITKYVTAESTALQAARSLVAKYARSVTRAVGELKVEYSERVTNYRALVEELVVLASTSGGVPLPYAGGISQADKDVQDTDTDVPERFRYGQDDNEGNTQGDLTP